MTDLVDYLRDKLGGCTCTDYIVGRPEVGYFRFWDWNIDCPQHKANPWIEHNKEENRLLNIANARDYEKFQERERQMNKLFKWPSKRS